MKKIALIILAVSLVAGMGSVSFAQIKSGFCIKGGFDFNGDSEIDVTAPGFSDSSSGDVDTGLLLGAEYLGVMSPMMSLGIGGSYQMPRKVDENDFDGKFNYANVFGMIAFTLSQGEVKPYIAGQIGYGFLFIDSTMEDTLRKGIYVGSGLDERALTTQIDTEGGIYWGIAFGLMLSNNVQIEFLYNVNNGVLKVDEFQAEGEHKYTKFTISVGYNFISNQ